MEYHTAQQTTPQGKKCVDLTNTVLKVKAGTKEDLLCGSVYLHFPNREIWGVCNQVIVTGTSDNKGHR